MRSLNRKEQALILIGAVVLGILVWNGMTSKKAEIRENCKKFVLNNGCHLKESQIKNFKAGVRLYELVEDTAYPSIKAACGCIEGYNVTPPIKS